MNKVIKLMLIIYCVLLMIGCSPAEEGMNEIGTIKYYGGEYSGEMKDGVPHGKGTWSHSDGYLYVGQFKDGEPYGEGSFKIALGRESEMVMPSGSRAVESNGKNDTFTPPSRMVETTKPVEVETIKPVALILQDDYLQLVLNYPVCRHGTSYSYTRGNVIVVDKNSKVLEISVDTEYHNPIGYIANIRGRFKTDELYTLKLRNLGGEDNPTIRMREPFEITFIFTPGKILNFNGIELVKPESGSIVSGPIIINGYIDNLNLTGIHPVLLIIEESIMDYFGGNQTGYEFFNLLPGLNSFSFSNGMDMVVDKEYDYILYIDENNNGELDPGEWRSVLLNVTYDGSKIIEGLDFLHWTTR